MKGKYINSVIFTSTEMQYLACLVLSSFSKPRAIATVLDKPIATVYSHINNIKNKTGSVDIAEIVIFVGKSKEFPHLKKHFIQLYINYICLKFSKTIRNKIRDYSFSTTVIVSEQLVKSKLFKCIQKFIINMGVKIHLVENKFNTEKCFLKNSLLEPNICILTSDELLALHKSKLLPTIDDPNTMCFFTDTKLKIDTESLASYTFYDEHNLKCIYIFLLEFFHKNHPPPKIWKEHINQLKNDINNIEKNIDFLGDLQKSDGSAFSEKKFKLKMISNRIVKWFILPSIIFLGAAYYVYNYTSNGNFVNTERKQPIVKSIKSSPFFKFINVPSRNTKFIGRMEELGKIKVFFKDLNIGKTQQVVISGAGGIGKTQLAAEYSYRSLEEKTHEISLWIIAEDSTSINMSYNRIAKSLGISTKNLTPLHTRRLVFDYLLEKYTNNNKNLLFIFDNAPDRESVSTILEEIEEYFFEKASILITSRSQHWNGNIIILDIFSAQEAKDFIKKHLNEEDDNLVLKLVQQLNYYPLAIEQAVKYIKQHTNIEDYLKIYGHEKPKFLDKNETTYSKYKNTLWKSINISIKKIDDAAKFLLFTSAYINPDLIQLSLFDEMPTLKRSKAISMLRRHSLIILNNDRRSFRVHRLLQEIIRLSLKSDLSYINEIKSSALSALEKFDAKNRKSWRQAKMWISHIIPLSEFLEQNIETIQFLSKYAKIAEHFGWYSLARSIHKSSFAIINTTNEKQISKIKLKILNNLSSIEQQRLGEYQLIKNYCLEALDILREKFVSLDDLSCVETLGNLGYVEWYLGNYTNSKKLLQKVVNILSRHYTGKSNIELGNALNNLGLVHWLLGSYDEAIDNLTRSLSIKEQYYDDKQHIGLSETLNNLAIAEQAIGNIAKSKSLLEQSINIKKNHYKNDNHIELADSMHNLCFIEEFYGNYNAAIENLKKSYHIRKGYYGKKLNTAMEHEYSPVATWPKLSSKNVKYSINYYKKSLDIIKNLYGDKHHLVARYHYMLGQAYEVNKLNKSAIDHYKISLEIAEDIRKKITIKKVLEGHENNIKKLRNTKLLANLRGKPLFVRNI